MLKEHPSHVLLLLTRTKRKTVMILQTRGRRSADHILRTSELLKFFFLHSGLPKFGPGGKKIKKTFWGPQPGANLVKVFTLNWGVGEAVSCGVSWVWCGRVNL